MARQAARRSAGQTIIADGSSQISARTMWKSTAAVSTSPAIQCMVTQANLTPRIGKNPVASRASTEAAITQWKMRSGRR